MDFFLVKRYDTSYAQQYVKLNERRVTLIKQQKDLSFASQTRHANMYSLGVRSGNFLIVRPTSTPLFSSYCSCSCFLTVLSHSILYSLSMQKSLNCSAEHLSYVVILKYLGGPACKNKGITQNEIHDCMNYLSLTSSGKRMVKTGDQMSQKYHKSTTTTSI